MHTNTYLGQRHDLFKSGHFSSERREYIINKAFVMLVNKGDSVAQHNDVLGADAVYAAALKYADSEEAYSIVADKRARISGVCLMAKTEQETACSEARIRWEKEKRKRRHKEKIQNIAAKALVAVFLVGVISTILFGTLFFIGVFLPVSKIVFAVSLPVTAAFLILVLVALVQEMHRSAK